MRRLIACLAALLLAACATPPQQPNPIVARAQSGAIVAGTLSLGPCEMSMAPYQTRIAVAVRKAARRVQDGRMTVKQAEALDKRAVLARGRLGRVCELEREGRKAEADHNRAHVARELPALEALIPEVKP